MPQLLRVLVLARQQPTPTVEKTLIQKIVLSVLACCALAVMLLMLGGPKPVDVAASTNLSIASPGPVATIAPTPSAVYRQLSELTFAERRAVYGRLPGAMKAKLWEIHVRLYLLDHELTDPQQALANELITAVQGRDLNTDGANIAAQLKASGFKQRARDQFKDTVNDAFYNLAGPEPPPSGKVKMQPARFLPGDCNCNHADDWCSGQSTCTICSACTQSSVGCGTIWLEACNCTCTLRGQ